MGDGDCGEWGVCQGCGDTWELGEGCRGIHVEWEGHLGACVWGGEGGILGSVGRDICGECFAV